MSKTIKLDDEVKEKLDIFRGKDETRSAAVKRLLNINEALGMLQDIIEGHKKQLEAKLHALEHQE